MLRRVVVVVTFAFCAALVEGERGSLERKAYAEVRGNLGFERVRQREPVRCAEARVSPCPDVGTEFRVDALRCLAHGPRTSWLTCASPHCEATEAGRLATPLDWTRRSWKCASKVSPGDSEA